MEDARENGMAATVRMADTGDVAALAAFAADTFVATYAAYNTDQDMADYLQTHFSPHRIEADLADEDGCFPLMHLGRDLVGYARLRQGDPGFALSAAPCWELERLYIAPAHHGRGLAPPLMAACGREARDRGYAGLWLGVWERNARAIRFYEKMGFRHEGNKTFILGADIQTDRVMTLAL